MKKLFYILLFIPFFAIGADHYIDNTQTTIPALSINNGDSIYFERGGEYYGLLSITSKNNVRIRDYGTGAKPVLHGFNTASSWVSVDGSLYYSLIQTDSSITQISFDGEDVEMGKGSVDSSITSVTTTYLKDASLSGQDWTGAVVIE